MDLGLRAELSPQQRQELQLRLSPVMIQSMEILQLPSLDLEERIEAELEENPVLDVVEEAQEAEEEEPQTPPPPEGADPSFSRLEDFSRSTGDTWEDFEATRPSRRFAGEEDPKLEVLQNVEGRPLTLAEHLEGQLGFVTDDERLKDLAREIIGNLDEAGYLRPSQKGKDPLEEILQSLRKRWKEPPDREELEQALKLVQSLDPPGVGGRSLEECLLLQLAREPHANPSDQKLAEAIIRKHLEDLGRNKLPKIARDLRKEFPELGDVTVDDVKRARAVIASLDPRPGRTFGGSQPKYIRPDVVVEKIDGRYEVRVENSWYPRLRLRSEYRELLSNRKGDRETRKFLRGKFQDAEMLLKALAMRENTLQRIATEIVELQRGFLEQGIEHLRPLRLQDVAERLGMHLSTVSRAISGKYMQTPRGIFEMKFFFPGGATRQDGGSESRNSVIARLKDLIAREDKRRPLSDEQLAAELKKQGIAISRRTVTKYREAEGIPASRERKCY